MTGLSKVPMVLVANKADLHLEREVPKDEGERLAARWQCGFVETSAKENSQVRQIFNQVLTQVEAMHGLPPGAGGKNCVIS